MLTNFAEQRPFTGIIKKIPFIKKPAFKLFFTPRGRFTRERLFGTFNIYNPFNPLKPAFVSALTTFGFFEAQKKIIKIIAAVLQRP